MNRIGALSGGSAFHERTLNLPRYRRFLSGIVHLADLKDGDLDAFDVVLVPDRLHLRRLAAAGDQVARVVERAGALVVLGEHPSPWLPGLAWEHRSANFWWWLQPGATSGLIAAQPHHSLFRYVTLGDATWHHHGVLHPPAGAETVIAASDGTAVVSVDRVSTPGTIVASTLDPVYHVGSYFMPAAGRFLDGLFPWMAEEL